ncbi:putative transmembrane protein [Rhodopirellula islandica]|uniref:Transmembrane protein n=1 Tax=Rhodopirellula islandica TaxID=595434 RepID=A0A0J1BAV4_RHOIS|nr:BatA domain-containing protein [Rhodopirellula islandica]KLU03807.1 putative transmembrane protein [Rhodopirellula islandica]
MNFLNLGLLAGALAFVVPLAIHLLFRSRYRSMDWGAMFLLQDVVAKNRRRMQWHQWILLALRCAIPILLALAMARPLLSSARALPGSEPLTLILCVDDSRSMQAAGRHDRVRKAATGLIENLSRGDEVIVIRASQLTAAFQRSAPRDALVGLSELPFDGPPSDYVQALDTCLDACKEASHPNRRIVLCGDFQSNCLAAGNQWIDAVEDARVQLDRMTPPPRVDFLNVAQADAMLDNLVVESLDANAPAVLKDRLVNFTAKIRNDSDRSVSRLTGRWFYDGQTVQTATLDIAPRSSSTLSFTHTPETGGDHSLAFAVEHTDAIAADNRRRLAIHVLPQIRVWLVDGNPSNEPLQSETDFLRLALSPFAFASVNESARADQNARSDLVSSRVFSGSRWSPELATQMDTAERPDVIIFANVKQIDSRDDSDNKLLEQFLAHNGKLVFFDGDQVAADQWNNVPWLPAKLDRLITASDVEAVLESENSVTTEEQDRLGFTIQPPRGRQSVWGSLQEAGDGIWEEVRVGRYRRLLIEDSATESTQVLLRTSDQAVLAVRRSNVIQFAIGCDTEWSTLPLRAVYLPMMQQLILDLVGSQESMNVVAGQPMLVPGPTASWTVTSPDGSSSELQFPLDPAPENDAPNISSGVFSDTQIAGIYRFRPKAPTTESSDGPATTLLRVAEIPAFESDLRTLEPSQIETFADRLQARLFDTPEDVVEATATDRFGQEIWRPLMFLVLLVLIAELLWQQFAGRPKSAATAWNAPAASAGSHR